MTYSNRLLCNLVVGLELADSLNQDPGTSASLHGVALRVIPKATVPFWSGSGRAGEGISAKAPLKSHILSAPSLRRLLEILHCRGIATSFRSGHRFCQLSSLKKHHSLALQGTCAYIGLWPQNRNFCRSQSDGRVFVQRWRSDHPKLSRQFRVSSRTMFSAVETQTVVLVSTAKVWISAPDT